MEIELTQERSEGLLYMNMLRDQRTKTIKEIAKGQLGCPSSVQEQETNGIPRLKGDCV